MAKLGLYDRPAPLVSGIAMIRRYLTRMKPKDRIVLRDELFEGYCPHCGESLASGPCHCWNDE